MTLNGAMAVILRYLYHRFDSFGDNCVKVAEDKICCLQQTEL